MAEWQDGKRRRYLCVLCGINAIGFGNNPEPLVEFEIGRCCDECNTTKVVPARLARIAQARRERE